METKWMSVDEASMYLGVKRDSIYRWVEKRGLPAYRIGRLLKFNAEELDNWVKEQKVEDKPAKTPRAKAK